MVTRNIIIFIPHNVPSLKNNKIKSSLGIFSSKAITTYLKSFGIAKYSSRHKTVEFYKVAHQNKHFDEYFREANIELPLKSPAVVKFHFVRKSKHRFDFTNAVEILADLMTAHNIIEDDNMEHFIPMPLKRDNKWFSYDKETPGVFIEIEYE